VKVRVRVSVVGGGWWVVVVVRVGLVVRLLVGARVVEVEVVVAVAVVVAVVVVGLRVRGRVGSPQRRRPRGSRRPCC
jgi:hypothetical protein